MNQDIVLLLIALTGLLVTIFLILYTVGYGKANDVKVESGGDEIEQRRDRRVDRGLAALRRRRGRNNDGAEEGERKDDEGGDNSEEENDLEMESTEPMTKKQLLKLQKKREKEEMRRYDESVREEQRRRESMKNEEYRKKQEERERIEQEKEAEEERIRAEKEKQEQEEFEKWKGMFAVEQEGSRAEEAADESQGLLQDFVDYIKVHKVVILEDLAAEFGLHTQDVINRVQRLEEMGRITGIFDDRGKFIYVTLEEMDKVAKFISKKGRIGIGELSAACNRLLTLDGSGGETIETKETMALDLNSEVKVTTERVGRDK